MHSCFHAFMTLLTMSVPKRRKTSSKTKKGRSHQALNSVQLAVCAKCAQAVLPHRVCANCGTYKQRDVLRTQADKKAGQLAKKEAKAKAAQKKV